MQTEHLEYFRRLVENSALAIALTDKEGRLVLFNRGAEKLTGYWRHEILGQPGSILYADREVVADIVREVESRKSVREQEVLLRARDGTIKPAALLVTRLYDLLGHPIGNLGIAIDLTKRKALQADVERATARAKLFNELLCQNIRRYAEKLERTMEKLQALPTLSERQERVLALCSRQAGRMRSLAEQVQSLSDLEDRAKVILQLRSLMELVQAGVQSVLDSHSDRKVDVRIEGFEDCQVLVCQLFEQVIHNLVNNAVVHNQSEDAKIWVSWEKFSKDGADWCRVFIEDNGPGIPDEHKQEVFERFVQLRRSGSGVGLSVVRYLVDRCGGSVHVEDRVEGQPDQGARFVLDLHRVGGADASPRLGDEGDVVEERDSKGAV